MSDQENEITVRVQGDTVRVSASRGAESPTRPVEQDPLRRATIEVFETWLRQEKKISKRRELEVLGMHLFEVLFNDADVRGFVTNKLSEAKNSKRRLRIQLCFEDAPELARLPWEYLYFAPPGGEAFFLAIKNDLVLSRFIFLDVDREPLKTDESRLRLLVIISEPTDEKLGTVLSKQVVEAIEELESSYPIEIKQLKQPRPQTLSDTLENLKPHVVHFIGHGRFNSEDRQGEIALIDADEVGPLWCSDKIFAGYFTQVSDTPVPRVVILQSCEGGRVDSNFAGLAPQLVLAGVQAVVAMQHPITNAAAISFCKGFYDALAKGSSVGHAVQKGRYKITVDEPQSWNDRVIGTPVLYMHSSDGIIVAAKEGSVPIRAAKPAGAPEVLSRPSVPSEIQAARPPAGPDEFVKPERGDGGERLPLDGAPRTAPERAKQ